MSVTAIQLPRTTLIERLAKPKPMLILFAIMWVPLTLYVMFDLSDLILLPAIPATIALYVVCLWAFRESTVALIGLTLVFFWLSKAGICSPV